MSRAADEATSPVSPAEYARWRATPLGRTTERLEMKLVFELAGDLTGKRVLDVGTGDGAYAIDAAARGARVVALDSAAPMLEAARRRAAERDLDIELREGPMESLPFDDGTIDVVIAVTVLCFVRDRTTAMRELARVLAPGGRLVLGELGRYSLWAASRRVRGWFGDRAWRDVHFWSQRELVTLVEDAGLRVREARGAVFYPPIDAAAILLAPLDPVLGRLHAPGAALLAVAAGK